MRIERLEAFEIETPMRFAVEHAAALRSTARNIWVRADEDGIEDWGESCPRNEKTASTS